MAFGAFATAAPVAAEPAVRRRSPIALFLLLPGALYLALFFLVPLVSLILTSFQAPRIDGDFGQYDYAFRWENYGDVVGTYLPLIGRSFLYAAIATILALLFSYPLAYFIGVKLRRYPLWQALALTLVIAPFFISFLLRTLAWKQVLSDDGPVVTVLHALSILPADAYINTTPVAVVFGITYNFIPFMTLPIYASLERLDLRYVEASNDLYASPVITFFRVTLPLSLPGVISGTLLTFIPASGDYVNASANFLGGSTSQMLGNVIESKFLFEQNYPQAAALSIVLMGIILVAVAAYVKRTGTEELL